ncbi:type III secretion chaperone protein SigE [Salmonella enterica subsp. enterica]|uniref:Type III secretion chaperone protein SigE n=1 Tax=Salmonella enterica I TaxID=59201 RepID=A0A447MUK4_SALET|nr:type III secretion chaperone protein SigE [Salmonella enterica subsp. enterica]
MESLLNRLYDALGLDAPEDEPLLIIDDGIQVYFNESDPYTGNVLSLYAIA